MEFDGMLADGERHSNLLVGHALRQQRQDLCFTGREEMIRGG